MAWVTYRTWAGAVTDMQIRVPLSLRNGIAAYGPSFTALTLLPGAIGTILNVLPDMRSKPSYVKFSGQLNWVYAVEVEVTRAMNTAHVWGAFANAHMNGGKATVVILRNVADTLEIDDRKR